MENLITTPNLSDPDKFYEDLLELHEGKDKDISDDMNAQLILVLANHIGDHKILQQAFELVTREGKSNGTKS